MPTLIRLPGYPLFLAVCFRIFGFDHYSAVMGVQCVIDLFTCLVIAGLANRLFGRRAAMAALWLAALCPFMAIYTAAPLTEVLTLACISVTFYGLERWREAGCGLNRWLWLMALAMAYSVLLRPEQGLLAAAVIPAMLWMDWQRTGYFSAKMVRPVALAALCVVLPLVPWTMRNWRTFHVVQPLAPRYATDPGEFVSLGFQRWYRTWAIDFASTEEVYWNYDSAPVDLGNLPARAFDTSDQYSRTAAILDDYNSKYNATPELDARFESLAEERIHDNPLRYYVALPVARLLNMLFRPRAEMLEIPLEWWRVRGHPRTMLIAAGLAHDQSGLLCAWSCWVIAMEASWLGTASAAGGGDGGLCRAALRFAADARQLRAPLHAGVLPVVDRVGELCLSLPISIEKFSARQSWSCCRS